MSTATPPILSSGDDDASAACLFHCRQDPSIHAVSRDRTGANIPIPEGVPEWIFDRMITLGVREAMPLHIAPEPVLRGLEADGFFIWKDRSNPMGTSQ
jgi:hypothetical protein